VFNVSHPWTPLGLEQPLEFYTSQEVECLVVRRASQGLKRGAWDQLPSPLIRRLPINNNSDIRALTLINGGRWLLVVSRFGSVSYYDLDIQNPVKRLLIPAVRLESRDDYFPCTYHKIVRGHGQWVCAAIFQSCIVYLQRWDIFNF